jgi:hypothetical protein
MSISLRTYVRLCQWIVWNVWPLLRPLEQAFNCSFACPLPSVNSHQLVHPEAKIVVKSLEAAAGPMLGQRGVGSDQRANTR